MHVAWALSITEKSVFGFVLGMAGFTGSTQLLESGQGTFNVLLFDGSCGSCIGGSIGDC